MAEEQEYELKIQVGKLIADLKKVERENEKLTKQLQKAYEQAGRAAQKAYSDAEKAAAKAARQQIADAKRVAQEQIRATREQIASHKRVIAATGALDKDIASRKSGFSTLFESIKTGAAAAVAAIAAIGAAFVAAFEVAKSAVEGVRIEQAFFNLAKGVSSSGDEILAAMKKASAGTIEDMELMKQANLALQLGVAKTPEGFEKLTKSALILGRSVGRGPKEALNDLINAAGRRSTEVLDNLGISLSEVNQRMEAMAQQEFGQTAESLDQATRNALFMRAAIEQANEQAENLGTSVDDVGSRVERVTAGFENLKQDGSEAFLIVADRGILAAEGIFNAFFGPDGVFPLFNEQGQIIQKLFAAITAAGLATAGTLAEQINRIRKVATGELDISELPTAGTFATDFGENFTQAMGKIVTDFEQIFNPAAGAEGIKPFFDGAADATADGVDDISKELDKLAEKKADVEREFAEDVEDANIGLQRDLEKIDLETERKRSDILRDGARQREAEAREHAQRLSDIRLENSQQVADAERDFGRETAELARKFSNERIELEQESRDKRVSIEEDFRKKIEEITRRADFDLEEASRNRDAVAFLKIQRQKQFDVNEARVSRDDSIKSLQTETQQRKAELERRQAEELALAQLHHEQQLQDLQINLERAIEAQNTAHQRELENLDIHEQQKLADLETWRERERQDAQTQFEQKLEDLQRNLNRELELIKAQHAELEAEAQRHAAAMAHATASARNAERESESSRSSAGRQSTRRGGRANDSPDFGSGGSIGQNSPNFRSGGSIGQNRRPRRRNVPSFATGTRPEGIIVPGQPGERVPIMVHAGERLQVTPAAQALMDQKANLGPNRVMASFGGGKGGGVSNVNNSRSINAPISLVDPSQLSPNQKAIVQNIVIQTLEKVL